MSFATLALVAMMATDDGRKELEELWDTLDKDGDGKVTSKEWGGAVFRNQDLMSKHFGGATLSEIGHAFNRIDINKDDSLTWEEFTTSAKSYDAALKLAASMKTDEGYADLKSLWDTLDKSGDGKVSGKEWGSSVYRNQDVMSKYFGGATLSEIGQAFNRIDSDGNDSLTWEEFCTECKKFGEDA
mmetsp:Transcript_27820/g.36268  ORF Transcript_27820/g.36268 Transcript_27820/m.36268 type:complete len:185 (+) Transcript_27820:55-609(+)